MQTRVKLINDEALTTQRIHKEVHAIKLRHTSSVCGPILYDLYYFTATIAHAYLNTNVSPS